MDLSDVHARIITSMLRVAVDNWHQSTDPANRQPVLAENAQDLHQAIINLHDQLPEGDMKRRINRYLRELLDDENTPHHDPPTI